MLMETTRNYLPDFHEELFSPIVTIVIFHRWVPGSTLAPLTCTDTTYMQALIDVQNVHTSARRSRGRDVLLEYEYTAAFVYVE